MANSKHGGARPNAGRPPKADELKLIEQMDAIMAPDEVWEKIATLCTTGDMQALKLWVEYRFGKPKQSVDLTTDGEKLTALTVQYVTPNEG
jgi:hypothetical protein